MELVSGQQVAEVRLMQMFPWFGVLKNARDEMSSMALSRLESLREVKLQVMYEVQQTWYELYVTHAALKVAEKNLQILRTVETLARIKFMSPGSSFKTNMSQSAAVPMGNSTNTTSGMTGMSSSTSSMTASVNSAAMPTQPMSTGGQGSQLANIYRIQIDIASLEDDSGMLQNQLATLKIKFNNMLNRNASMSVFIPDTLVADPIDLSLYPPVDSLLKNNPMLKMIQYDQQALEARKRMIKRMGYPMIGIGLSYSLINKSAVSTSSMNGRDMIMPMATITLPIYRQKYRSMQSETSLLQQATTQNYQTNWNSLLTEYAQARQLYSDALRRFSIYSTQLQLSQKSLNITLQNFAASGAGLTEILLIRQQLHDFELKKIKAVADLNTAIAMIKKLTALYNVSE
jgi:outer membrane protein TolC